VDHFAHARNMNDKPHPVWTVYDKLHRVRSNAKYYGRRLSSVERLNFSIELVLALLAPSSAFAGLWFFSNSTGKEVFQSLGVLTAVLVPAKPLLNLTKRIRDYESLLSGYRGLDFDLTEIKRLIEERGKYDQTLQAELRKVVQREKLLIDKIPERRESQRIRKQCEDEVSRELPKEKLFVPPDEPK
jgi:hypothetical protein